MDLQNITWLRNNIYQAVDRVIATGVPLNVERKGKVVKVVMQGKVDKFAQLVPHRTIVGDPDELVIVQTSVWQEGEKI